jgi:hypothetical protein
MQSPIQIISLHENQVPAGMALKSEVSSFWRKLFRRAGNGDQGVEVGALQRLNERRLQNLIPQLDESDYFEAFDQLPMLQSRNLNSMPVFLIEPPFSHLDDKLNTWAAKSGRTVVDPPENLLGGAPFDDKDIPEGDWIIPNLERWFIRHPRGLEQVRSLFRYLVENDTSRGIIACHSWSWNFLQKAIGIQPPQNRLYTLKSTGVEEFAREILYYVYEKTGQEVELRQTNNGQTVIKWKPETPESPVDPTHPPVEIGDFMKQLISYSRGNRSIAVSFWKKSLRTEPDEELENSETETSRDHFWVVPWADLELPFVPSHYNWKHLTILHTLLIHERLSQELLNKLLPQNDDELTMLITELIHNDLVAREGRQLRITENGYPAIRQQLNQHGYQTDML